MSVAPADLMSETVLTMAQAARRFPPSRLGHPVSPATISRWCRRGVKVPGVGTVFLEAVRLSGRWLTTVEAISRFAARQTPVLEVSPPAPPRTPRVRERAAARAEAELRSLGI
jgi:hypothetical protein